MKCIEALIKYADIHEQQRIDKRDMEMIQEQLQLNPIDGELLAKEKEYRTRNMCILNSSLSLIK